jgi:hypothetical protein
VTLCIHTLHIRAAEAFETMASSYWQLGLVGFFRGDWYPAVILHSAAQLLSPPFVVLSGSGGPVLISIGGTYKPFLCLCDAAYHDPQFSSSASFRSLTYISLQIVQIFHTHITLTRLSRSLFSHTARPSLGIITKQRCISQLP